MNPHELAALRTMAVQWAADSDAVDLADDRALVRLVGRADFLIGELLRLVADVEQGATR